MQKVNNTKIKMQKLKDTIYLCGSPPQACSLPDVQYDAGDDSRVIYFI
jgi:hypothetical protein